MPRLTSLLGIYERLVDAGLAGRKGLRRCKDGRPVQPRLPLRWR